MKLILLFLLLLPIATISFANVYKWVDEKGVIHFTDDFLQIPEKYRSGTRKIEFRDEKVDTNKGSLPSPSKKEEIYRDQLGRGETYWRALVGNWKIKLKASQDKTEALKEKYNELTEKYNRSKKSIERAKLRRDRDEIKNEMDQQRLQIEEAMNLLEKKIPEEAELFKAKPEWIK